jgi:hypothetical protein
MRKGQKKPVRREIRKTVRFSLKEWNRVRILINEYAGGIEAKWLRHGALEGERRYLK